MSVGYEKNQFNVQPASFPPGFLVQGDNFFAINNVIFVYKSMIQVQSGLFVIYVHPKGKVGVHFGSDTLNDMYKQYVTYYLVCVFTISCNWFKDRLEGW